MDDNGFIGQAMPDGTTCASAFGLRILSHGHVRHVRHCSEKQEFFICAPP